jgi:hypothetical protein
MPELVPTWHRLVELAGGGELVAQMLTLYNPPAYLTGSSWRHSVDGFTSGQHEVVLGGATQVPM